MDKPNLSNQNILYYSNNQNIVHFIKCGSADSILIESKGRFGLIDTSNPYQYIKDEVEHVQINESKGERNQWSSSPDESVQAVLNYLDYLKVDKLDFILGTHAHSDHIGGVPAIAYKYVDSNTKYYYREYRNTAEDTTNIDWANYKYYLAAVHSMKLKGAQMIDLTNNNIKFDFGEFNLEFLNTDVDPEELKLGENQNSIVTLLKYKNTKLFLAADMISKDDKNIKDYIGKIDILKLAHHGYSESSYDFLSTTRPNYVVISNTHIPKYATQILSYLKGSLNSKIYLTQNVSGTSKSVQNSAIKLYFDESKNFYFSNTGAEVSPDSSNSGWSQWCDYWTYLEKGQLAKGWKELDWSKGNDWFYFNQDGIMVTGWQELQWSKGTNWFYFDKANGNMLIGWQQLEWTGGKDWFYFLPENGTLVQDTCITISGKNYCFDKNGCLI
jgi:beta-lactamase superfamily II metal-dependent hydrolase